MDAAQFLRKQFATVHRVGDGVVGDLTDDLLNWMPPGTANSVGATLIHCINAEDVFVQEMVQEKPSVWKTGDWEKRTGLKVLPARGGGWEEVRSHHLSTGDLRSYLEAVRSATNGYLETVTSTELDRQGMLFGKPVPVGDLLAMLVEHTAHHIGEIAALKGVQGTKGMPF